MTIRIRKTDKRFGGYEHFQYVVDLPGYRRPHKIVLFNEIRKWCADTWGLTCEKDAYLDLVASGATDALDYKWVWHHDSFSLDFKIFLVSDKELTWFNIKWSGYC